MHTHTHMVFIMMGGKETVGVLLEAKETTEPATKRIQWKNGKKSTTATKVAIIPRIINAAAVSRRIFTSV